MKVTSLELAEKLKESGFPQDGYFVYRHWRSKGEIMIDVKKDKYYDYPKSRNMPASSGVICSAPSVDEILNLLPYGVTIHKTEINEYTCHAVNQEGVISGMRSAADAVAKMWLYLKERKKIDNYA